MVLFTWVVTEDSFDTNFFDLFNEILVNVLEGKAKVKFSLYN